MESSKWQEIVGKRILGLKVIDMDGQRIGLGMEVVRALSKYLSALILGIGFQIVWFGEKHQALHE